MKHLESSTVLHRVAEIDLSLAPTGEIDVHFGTNSVHLGPTALGLLDVFTTEKSVAEAVLALTPRLAGAGAVDEVLAEIGDLVQLGVLRKGARTPAPSERGFPLGYYDSPGVHIRILSDQVRRSAFIGAVRSLVRDGDVVVDIGTGSGVLAVAAAQAGARRVYAIEPSLMAASARAVMEDNGVADVVEVVDGWASEIQLPERADLLLSDFVSSEPLSLGLLEILRDARERLLRPGGQVLPRSLDMSYIAVEVPRQLRSEYVYTEAMLDRWHIDYGIDFRALAQTTASGTTLALLDPARAISLTRLSAPARGWSIDLCADDAFPFECVTDLKFTRKGRFAGILGVSNTRLTPELSFTADPRTAGLSPQWFAPVWMLPEEVNVMPGTQVAVRHRYLGRGRTILDLLY